MKRNNEQIDMAKLAQKKLYTERYYKNLAKN